MIKGGEGRGGGEKCLPCSPLNTCVNTFHLEYQHLSLFQVKIDEAQLKEQEALRKQLQQEQDLLQTFQEAQDQKLKVQHEREHTALDEKVELSKKELDKEVHLATHWTLLHPTSIITLL